MSGAVVSRDGVEGVGADFLELPAMVYARDPNWIPEEADAVARAFSAANPWFVGRSARTFVVPGLARAAAFYDPALEIKGERVAFFGYWESAGDADADLAVMDDVRAWARARGAQRLYGPIQFTTAHTYRFLVSAEPNALPMPGEPYNPLHYAKQIEALGFAVERRFLTLIVSATDAARTYEKRASLHAKLASVGYRFERLDSKVWMESLDDLYEVVESSFHDNFAYAPMTIAQFRAVAGESIAKKLSPELSFVVYAPGGAIAGFAVANPHYGPLIVASAGAARVKTSDLSYEVHAPLLAKMGPIDYVLKTICLVPEHQKVGLGAVVVALFGKKHVEAGGGRVFGALTREDGVPRHLTEGADAERWYALYTSAL